MPLQDGTGPFKNATGPKDGRGFVLANALSDEDLKKLKKLRDYKLKGLGKKTGGQKGNC